MKAPYRVLFSNDTTGLSTCKSPYNPEPNWTQDPETGRWNYLEHFSETMLEASVDETAGQGIDVHMLQPGVGWVPWWKSRCYPFSEHVKFMKERTGMDPSANAFAEYMANGGDMVDVFIRRCRKKSLAPFISMRLNDSHGHEFVTMDPKDMLSWAWHVFCPIHVKHPEWRISQDIKDWNGRVLNWAIPDVVDYRYRMIEEICEQYDIDGLELDFMRHNRFFNESVTPSAERQRIMNGFIVRVRALLDRTAKNGKRRWLCVRIPAFLSMHDDLGIHLPDFAAAGVDMVNLSYYYYTGQQADIRAIRELIPEQSLYVEMCHCTTLYHFKSTLGYDSFAFRPVTPRQYWTTAHLAYVQGADGMSTFNFQYYREHGTGPRGPFAEPPFEMHRVLQDKERLATEPQHYFIGRAFTDGAKLPTLKPGAKGELSLNLAPPKGGWQKGGILRIQSDINLDSTWWKAKLNGTRLEKTDERGEPYEKPYPNLLGCNESHRAWIVPAELLKPGQNSVEIEYAEGSIATVTISFVDLAVS